MDPKNEEKRTYNRINVDCEVYFAVGLEPDKSKRVYLRGDVKDLSAGGLSFESAKELPVGQMLHLTLDFPKKKNLLHIRGVVRRCQPLSDGKAGAFIIGVEFIAKGNLNRILLDYI